MWVAQILSGGVVFCGAAAKRVALLDFLTLDAASGGAPALAELETIVHVDDKR